MDKNMLTSSVASSAVFTVVISTSSLAAERVPDSMPPSIPADQTYYWSIPWQDDVRASMEALARGDFVEFDSDDPNDIVRWFLSDDE